MAWTTPMTAVANAVWTVAQYNTYVRDNLLVSEAALATAEGQYFVASAANTLVVRTAARAYVDAAEATSSTSYVGLTTACAVTVTTGTRALVHIATHCTSNTANTYNLTSFAVSGATTLASSDDNSIYTDGLPASSNVRAGATMFPTLTAGSNTFTMQHAVQSGTATFSQREIIVISF